MKDVSELKFFFDIEFARSKEGNVMNQRKYTLKFISQMELSGANQFIHHGVWLTCIEFMNYKNKQFFKKLRKILRFKAGRKIVISSYN